MTLALIAGQGDLPTLVAGACSTPPILCVYDGVHFSGRTPDLGFRLETLGSFLLELKNLGVSKLCFAGALERPVLDTSLLDAQTMPLMPLFMQALEKGDDGALRILLELFEDAGFEVVGAHEIAPDLLAGMGVYGQIKPDSAMQQDADVAAAHIRALSAKDIGQACIVKAGRVVAMEDARGTDAMLAGVSGGAGGILYKGAKTGQSRKIDLPTIGPDTLRALADAGLRGLVVEQGDVLILHAAECQKIANERALAFWARSKP